MNNFAVVIYNFDIFIHILTIFNTHRQLVYQQLHKNYCVKLLDFFDVGLW
jgi:hypothetical protein